MGYPKAQMLRLASAQTDISAATATISYVTPSPMIIYGFFGEFITETVGTIDTATIELVEGSTTKSTITPVTGDAVGLVRQGTQFAPYSVAAAGTIKITKTQDASQAGVMDVYIWAEIFPVITPA